jgi:nickel transport protein
MIFRVSSFLVVLFFFPVARAHGVNGDWSETKAVVIRASYDDGLPLAFAQVSIYSPGDREHAYQVGRTDKQGAIAFLPFRPGPWKVVISDKWGHGFSKVLEIKKGLHLEAASSQGSRWQKALMGFCLLWGTAGTLLYLRVRRRTPSERRRKEP